MERLTDKNWRNLDPWECCGQDQYCKRGCHEKGGCTNGCIVPKLYENLAKYEDIKLMPEQVREHIDSSLDAIEMCKVKIALDKLREYEDLEKQGMLLKVQPCRVGEAAYVIDKDSRTGKLSIFAGKWDVVSFRVLKNGKIDVHGEVSYEIPDIFTDGNKTMPACMYVGQNSTKFEDVVFLTKEEAEQALAKIGGDVDGIN